jgi:hypothetical protein
MRVFMRRLAAALLLTAVCLYVPSAPGWEAAASSGHEHMHAEVSGEWSGLLVKLKSFAEMSSVMLLLGVFVFRAVLLPASGEREVWPAIGWIERIASVAALYALMLAGSNNSLTIIKVAVAIVWLLAVWEIFTPAKLSTVLKTLCALVLVPLLHMESVGAFLSITGTIAVLVSSIHTASLAVWIGGGVSVYAALARKPELSGPQLQLLLARFMTWAAAACCGIVFSSLIGLFPGPGADGRAEWMSRPEDILILFKLLLILVIVWVATDGYRRWRRAGDEEMRFRFRYKQSVRFSLSLTVLVMLVSALVSTPVPGGSVLKEPIYWHVMGQEAHMSLRIREWSGRGQQVRLDIWLPSGTGNPVSAEVALRRDEKGVKVPILYKEGGPDPYGFEGFDKYTYESEGNYMAGSGSWTIEVVVTDGRQKRHTYEKVEVIP